MTSTGMVRMLTEGEIATTIRYISDRRCPSGGYCFYQLDEPNLSDTWYALGSLAVMNNGDVDEKTRDYLARYHHQVKGTAGLYRLWYLFWSYQYMTGTVPDDLTEILAACPLPELYEIGTVESVSMFEQLYCYAVLSREAGNEQYLSGSSAIEKALQRWVHPSGGYGRDRATLVETRHAVAICIAFGIGFDRKGVLSFLHDCMDPQSGFVNVPSSHPGFLEHLDAGIALAHLLDVPVPNLPCCREFLTRCRNSNGGYARSGFGGNSTLEYTWFAIRSLSQIHKGKVWRW